MLNFKIHNDLPNPYCVVNLSDDTIVYENNVCTFWRELKNYCDEHSLTINSMSIFYRNTTNDIFVSKNNIKRYFVIHQAKVSIGAKKAAIKKGYGVVCIHPGGIKKVYISWYDNYTGKLIYHHVIRGGNKVYEEEIGIPKT